MTAVRPSIAGITFAVTLLLSLSRPVPAQSDTRVLEPGKTIERELSAGQVHTYQIQLTEKQYLRVAVEQIGIDVIVKISGPDGRPISEVNNWRRTKLLEHLLVLAETSGQVQVEVIAAAKDAVLGRYELRSELLSPTTAEDKARITAIKNFVEAEHLRVQSVVEKRRTAVANYEEALTTWRNLKDSREEAETLYGLGYAHLTLAEDQKALSYLLPALTLHREIHNRRGEVKTLLGIAGAYRNGGDMKEALNYLNELLPVTLEIRDLSAQADTFSQFGAIYSDIAEFGKAQEYNQKALDLYQRVADRKGQANTLNSIGVVYERLGEHQKALQVYEQALPLSRALGDRLVEAFLLNNIGEIKRLFGDPQSALDWYIQSNEAFKRIGYPNYQSIIVSNIGRAYEMLGEYQKALDSHSEALALARQAKSRSAEAITLNKLGDVYERLSEHPKALDYYTQALTLYRAVDDQLRVADMLRSIGDVHESLGEPQKALDYYNQALPIQRLIRDRKNEATTLLGMSRAFGDLKQPGEARGHIESALKIIEVLRTDVLSPDLRSSFLASKNSYYELYINLLMQPDPRGAAEGNAAEALQANERARARGLLDVLSEGHADIRQGIDPTLLETERNVLQRLNLKTNLLTRLLASKHTDEQEAAARKELDTLVAEYQEVEAQIRARSPRYAELTQPVPLNLKQIQTQVLDSETLLLEYSLGEEKSFLWAVTTDSIKSFELPKRATIEAATKDMYDLLTVRSKVVAHETPAQRQSRIEQADAAYPRAATALSTMILKPVASELGKKRLVVVSDGALQYVPFGALPVPVDNGQPQVVSRRARQSGYTPLIVEHELVSLPSASVLAALRRDSLDRRQPNKTIAVLADPVFSGNDPRISGASGSSTMPAQLGTADVLRSAEESGLRDFVRLRFSRDEADAITRLVPGASKLRAVDFAANRLTATSPELSEYRIVHFATHGLINSRHPELSGLVLSLVNEKGQAQDGFLRLYEIYNLHLRADLVVLSACQTALGKEIKGEGLVGLTRGFMYAGAPRVVASLWRVDDRATAELMRRFYEGMLGKHKLSAAAALRAAQMKMWEGGWENPAFWAAFTLQGEWR
jgi:CHAT domain-containing protein/tetratricopeptide (TPR) repeat protein